MECGEKMTDKLPSNEALIAATIGMPSTRCDLDPPSLGDDAERLASDIRNALAAMGCKMRDGYPGRVSEFGVPYVAVRFGVQVGDFLEVRRRAISFAECAIVEILRQGADTLVWRIRPEVKRGQLKPRQPEVYQVYMRLHGLYSGASYNISEPSCEGGVTFMID